MSVVIRILYYNVYKFACSYVKYLVINSVNANIIGIHNAFYFIDNFSSAFALSVLKSGIKNEAVNISTDTEIMVKTFFICL